MTFPVLHWLLPEGYVGGGGAGDVCAYVQRVFCLPWQIGAKNPRALMTELWKAVSVSESLLQGDSKYLPSPLVLHQKTNGAHK